MLIGNRLTEEGILKDWSCRVTSNDQVYTGDKHLQIDGQGRRLPWSFLGNGGTLLGRWVAVASTTCVGPTNSLLPNPSLRTDENEMRLRIHLLSTPSWLSHLLHAGKQCGSGHAQAAKRPWAISSTRWGALAERASWLETAQAWQL